MNDKEIDVDKLKSDLQRYKDEMQVTGKAVVDTGLALSKASNNLKFFESLEKFNTFITGMKKDKYKVSFEYHALHRHVAGFTPWLKNQVSKLVSDNSQGLVDSYIDSVLKHFTVHDQWLKTKIKLKHNGILMLKPEDICKSYLAIFQSGDKAAANKNEFEAAKMQAVQETKNGVPTVYEVSYYEVNNKTGESKLIKKFSSKDLNFTHISEVVKFTNGAKVTRKVYESGIYDNNNIADDGTVKPDGKMNKSKKFTGGPEKTESSEIEIIEETIKPVNKESDDANQG